MLDVRSHQQQLNWLGQLFEVVPWNLIYLESLSDANFKRALFAGTLSPPEIDAANYSSRSAVITSYSTFSLGGLASFCVPIFLNHLIINFATSQTENKFTGDFSQIKRFVMYRISSLYHDHQFLSCQFLVAFVSF